MRLEVGRFPVREVVFGSATAWHDGVLTVDREGVLRTLMSGGLIDSVELEVAMPGEAVRLWPVRDVLEPMVKVDGPGQTYPGMCGRPAQMVGSGRTHRLTNMALVEISSVGWHDSGHDHVFMFLDMVGPWADVMPYGSLVNLGLVVEPKASLPIHEKNQVIHGATLTLSDLLAEAVKELDPPDVEVFELSQVASKLPKVVYLMGLHSPQAMSGSAATFGNATYGRGYLDPPWLIHPNEIFDGAVTGPYRTGFATSWTMSNNPVLFDLSRRHGRDIEFLGVIVVRTEWTTWAEKELVGKQAAKLAKMLGADGALMTWDAGGNEFIEVIRTIEACEQMGIKTVFLTSEDNSYDGAPTMLEPIPEADAIVSTGFYQAAVQEFPEAPEMNHVIGLQEMPGGSGLDGPMRKQMMPATARMPVPRRYDDHYGYNNLSVIDY